MPMPRNQQICLEDTPYYHCVSRCVRHAFLCGENPITGVSYEHRRAWVENRLLFLASIFSIDICAYAVMSNHLHVVVHVDLEDAGNWSTMDVLKRWHKLHKGTTFTQQYVTGEQLPKYVVSIVEKVAKTYRERLTSISWFMKELNEPIARKANAEEKCTGHFWEGRFKTQALLDEAALLACMAYVDLNPIRSNICKTPETSDHTSIKKRVVFAREGYQSKMLHPFVGNPKKDMSKGLPFRLQDYLELVDATGRIIRTDKSGSIDVSLLPILQRLNISTDNWLAIAKEFEGKTGRVVGKEMSIHSYCESHHMHRRPSRNSTKLLA
ncbi:transposase [Marinomonas dokdonensis]|uniref:transposase n=1 Tax=Marinomonas dokdonensis TaxID=328224 RepID=UPI0040556FD8